MSSIEHRSGSEGPHHDPYHYDEFTVRNARGNFTIHHGLAEWVEIKLNGGNPVRFDDVRLTTKELDSIFEGASGVTVKTAWRTPMRLRDSRFRAHRSHGGMECVSGMPGETMTVCKCGDVVDCDFNEGAVI